MNKVSIVIPNYNRYDLCHQLLYDIYQHCSTPLIHEVIVVNDGCTQPESFTGLEWWSKGVMLPVRALNLEENVGFLKASNTGMKDATGDIIALISNDVRIKGDVVGRIEHLAKNTTTFIGGKYLDYPTGWNQFGNKIYPYLEGWLLAGHRWVWEGIGYFDERYIPNDFEDVDASTMALSLGYTLVSLPDDITQHLGAQSIGYNPKREELTKRNKKKFEEKWIK